MVINVIIFILVFTLLYLLVIMPKLRRNPDSRKLDGWLYAHRGFFDNESDAPENSLKAFRLAVENKYGIELDVQLTKDNVPVIMHDYDLKRACGVERKISEVTYDELQQYHLFQSGEKIPTFIEALEVIDGKVPLIIELKIPLRPAGLCARVSEILKTYPGVYCVESFNPFGLLWYKKHYPRVVRGQLATDFVKEKTQGSRVQYFILKHLLMNFLTKPDFIAYQYLYKRDLSFLLCRKLYRVKTVAWTIQNQEEFDDNKKSYELIIFESFTPEP